MVIEDDLPFLFVDGNRFKKFIRVVELGFNLPCHYTMMKDCVKMYLKTTSDLKHMFITTNQRMDFYSKYDH